MVDPIPDEHRVFNHAAMHGGVMSDGDPIAHDDRIDVALAVENGAILDVGLGTDADGIHIAAEHGIHPNRRVLAKRHVADQLGRKVDVTTGGHLGKPPLVTPDHGF
jgi:isopentenyl phosphate kinase